MIRKDLDFPHGSMTFLLYEEEAHLENYRGKDVVLAVPSKVEGKSVTRICKKAFLGVNELAEISLPETIREIEDYVFAGCGRLKKVTLPYSNSFLGKGVFQDCQNLIQICPVCVQEENKAVKDASYLLPAATGLLQAPYLFDLQDAGKEEWFSLWDKRMKTVMDTDDSEGFSKMLLCGEEDYGSKETDPAYYQHAKRMGKVRVALLRCMHDAHLTEEDKDRLWQYLASLCKKEGAKELSFYEETWQVILKEHGDDRAYYEFLFSLGGVTKENYDGYLKDLGDRHTEMKSLLIQYYEENIKEKDAFSMFEL